MNHGAIVIFIFYHFYDMLLIRMAKTTLSFCNFPRVIETCSFKRAIWVLL
jgi:hypothetical protein